MSTARRCRTQLETLRSAMVVAELAHTEQLGRVHPAHRSSAINLVHYVELRRHEVRGLQADLAAIGVSSLSHVEQSVLSAVDTVILVLGRLLGDDVDLGSVDASGTRILERNADALLGECGPERRNRIMVTLPSDAANESTLADALAEAGMDIARINCAHDDAATWRRLAEHVTRASPRAKIAMDLAGPKLRTGEIEPAEPTLKLTPRRDEYGRVVQPSMVLLAADHECAKPSPYPVVPVTPEAWLTRRRPGESISLRDTRGSARAWSVVETAPEGCVATVPRTTYVAPGTALTGEDGDTCVVAELPPRPRWHRVEVDHVVILTSDGRSVPPSPDGAATHRIGCTLPEAFRDCRPGERVWFDDGKIGGVIVDVDEAGGEIVVRLTDVHRGGAKLRGGKGINLPDTNLHLPALTAKDLEDLASVALIADIVDVSFVRSAADVEALQTAMAELGCSELGIVLKIETRAGFEHLPSILLQAMQQERVGVMIARGDLAVEVGFERLAEVQEEILWLCEAARMPVIWATQVLDSMARTGRPSRAEITDAARSHRAECVMLNKGPHITEVMRSLTTIVERMDDHQDKKHHLLRRLRSWDGFRSGAE